MLGIIKRFVTLPYNLKGRAAMEKAAAGLTIVEMIDDHTAICEGFSFAFEMAADSLKVGMVVPD